MKLTPWYLAALAPIAAAGCSGTVFGHVAVLAVTLGIFFGTLSLGRGAASTALRPVGGSHGGAPGVAVAAVAAEQPAATVVSDSV